MRVNVAVLVAALVCCLYGTALAQGPFQSAAWGSGLALRNSVQISHASNQYSLHSAMHFQLALPLKPGALVVPGADISLFRDELGPDAADGLLSELFLSVALGCRSYTSSAGHVWLYVGAALGPSILLSQSVDPDTAFQQYQRKNYAKVCVAGEMGIILNANGRAFGDIGLRPCIDALSPLGSADGRPYARFRSMTIAMRFWVTRSRHT
jgi:hypothetical protein